MEGKKLAGIPMLATKELAINQAFKEVIKELDNIKVQKTIYDDYRLVIDNFIATYLNPIKAPDKNLAIIDIEDEIHLLKKKNTILEQNEEYLDFIKSINHIYYGH